MNSSEIKDGTIYEKKAMILLGTGKKCGSGNQVHTWNDLEETRKKRTFRYEGDGNNATNYIINIYFVEIMILFQLGMIWNASSWREAMVAL